MSHVEHLTFSKSHPISFCASPVRPHRLQKTESAQTYGTSISEKKEGLFRSFYVPPIPTDRRTYSISYSRSKVLFLDVSRAGFVYWLQDSLDLDSKSHVRAAQECDPPDVTSVTFARHPRHARM